jgi:hypothetical protein
VHPCVSASRAQNDFDHRVKQARRIRYTVRSRTARAHALTEALRRSHASPSSLRTSDHAHLPLCTRAYFRWPHEGIRKTPCWRGVGCIWRAELRQLSGTVPARSSNFVWLFQETQGAFEINPSTVWQKKQERLHQMRPRTEEGFDLSRYRDAAEMI